MTDNNVYHLLLYHGTSQNHSNNITKNGFKLPEKKKDHWIGNGIYFFREDQSQALSWAILKFQKCPMVSNYHVIKINIDVKGDNFLNLDSREGLFKYKEHGTNFLRKLKEEGIELEFASENEARCFIIDSLPKQYTVIQRTFEGQGTSKSIDNNHIIKMTGLFLQGTQVCVRDEKAITANAEVVQEMPRAIKTKTSKKRKTSLSTNKR
ncbi:hypothetical protein [Paenibacillus bouchesdurhonensis]|uniref:hypothetical protein n=1 Tax=Paenibacillus bouchesdurhonensis TaxID=1870990 RepID=UPI000DA63F80|nr:hypothetical protein [Paenibacillus bouchesdurhonensis]